MSDEFQRKDSEPDDNKQEPSSAFHDDKEKIKEEAYNQAVKMVNGKMRLPRIRSKEDARRLFFAPGRIGKVYGIFKAYCTRVGSGPFPTELFDETGKKISWNWAAFIFNPTWFFSRKMYLFGMIGTFMTSVYTVGSYMIYNNINHPNIVNIILPWSLLFLAMYVAVGMFGNYLYISHMENKIVYPGERELTEEQIAQINFMRGGVSINGIIMAFLASNIMLLIVEELVTMMY